MARPAREAGTAPAVGGEERDESTRERILRAALHVFAMRGFDGARTREIADLAGANLGLIKYYFDGKERLWREAVGRAFGELAHELGDALEPGRADEREQLEQVVRRFVRFVARNPAFMQLMNDEGKRDGRRMRWLADRYVRPLYEAMRARVEAAQASGLLPDVSPVSLHYVVLGATGLVFSEAAECRYVTGVDPSSEEFADAHADAVLQLLTAGVTASTSGRSAGGRKRRSRRGKPGQSGR
jgi:AcrR family transcriptional regulator